MLKIHQEKRKTIYQQKIWSVISCFVRVMNFFFSAHFLRCPDGWVKYKGYCYLVQFEVLPWQAALDSCISRGSNLVSIADQAEADFIKSYAHSDQVGLN